jgi:predicted RNA methylase
MDSWRYANCAEGGCESVRVGMFSLLKRLGNMMWERRLGITTRGLANVDGSSTEQIHYGTISYGAIGTILDHLQLNGTDVFVDLGCGKGRVLCCAALHPIDRAIGVECSRPLSDIAKVNAAGLRPHHSPIEIHTTEAQRFDYAAGTVFYLFHPFGPNTLRAVLLELQKGLQASPRQIRIVYVNPVHNNVLSECSWLEEYERWDVSGKPSLEHPVAWWRNTGYRSL